MKRLNILLLAGAIASFSTTASAQDRDAFRTDTWGIYAQGGLSWAGGADMKNVNATSGTNISPLVGLGVDYNFRPWVRAGLNYEFSKFAREQRFDGLQPLPEPDPTAEIPAERLGGTAYRNTWSHYHALDLTAEFNIMEIWKNRKAKWFNLYGGIGIGGMFAKGNSYELSMGYDRWSAPEGNSHEMTSWLKAHNSRHRYDAFYIPVLLAAEFDVMPRLTLGMKFSYKFLCTSAEFAPGNTGALAITARYNFLGAKQGYKGNKRRLAETTARYGALKTVYDRALEECREEREAAADAAEAQAAEIAALTAENTRLKTIAEENARLRKQSGTIDDFSVQFRFNSAVLTQKQQGRLMRYLETADPDALFTVIGEANDEGDPDWNYQLSERRMRYVVGLLNDLGIGADRIKSVEAIGNSKQIKDPIARRVTIIAGE